MESGVFLRREDVPDSSIVIREHRHVAAHHLSVNRTARAHELERTRRRIGYREADTCILVAESLSLEVEEHRVLSRLRRLDDLRPLEDAVLLDVVSFVVRHLERNPLVLPRHEITRRVASNANLRAIAGLSVDLVLAVPVPDVSVLQQSTAMRVDVHAVGILPDAAVRQRGRRRRKECHDCKECRFHISDILLVCVCK